MGLALVGVSHHDVPLSLLDDISRSAASLPEDLVREPHAGVSGAVLLSTCNRVELYIDAEDTRRAAEAVQKMFVKRLEMEVDVDVLAPRVGTDVARHLFSVAAGLESMVVGEDEVSGQVRRALTRARTDKTTSSSLERLFQAAAATHKQVTANTGLGAAGRSIASVALDLVESEGESIAGRPVLLIGTGSFARVVHATLMKRGAEPPMVYSSSGRAKRFVESHGGTPITTSELFTALEKAELVVSCSGAPHPVLDANTLAMVTQNRVRPLPVLDLALTQDVEDEARSLTSVRIIDLDFISRHAPAEHTEAITRAQRMVNEAVESFGQREAGRSADAVVVALRKHVREVMERERTRAQTRLSPEAAGAVEEALHRFVGELLHEPTIRAREYTREGLIDEFENAVHVMFGIDASMPPS
ncbi:MAG: glutamyl-tRNA reductase [Actinomycetes bacterium]